MPIDNAYMYLFFSIIFLLCLFLFFQLDKVKHYERLIREFSNNYDKIGKYLIFFCISELVKKIPLIEGI